MSKEKYFIDILKICLAIEHQDELLDDLKCNILNKDIIEQYVDCVLNVFCRFGLKNNDEPNECGLILEDLINVLNNQEWFSDEQSL